MHRVVHASWFGGLGFCLSASAAVAGCSLTADGDGRPLAERSQPIVIEGGFTCDFNAPVCNGAIDLVYELPSEGIDPIVLDPPRPSPRPDTGALECPFDDPSLSYDPTDPYPFCQFELDSGWELYCPEIPERWGYMNWRSEGLGSRLCDGTLEDCNACVCSSVCGSSSDCPSPTSGTARAECMTWSPAETRGECLLGCEGGAVCPDGMQCVDNLEFGRRICAWVVSGNRCTEDGR